MTNPLDLRVPPVSGLDIGEVFSPVEIRRWLDGLPKLDELQIFDVVLNRLREINRAVLAPPSRLELVDCFAAEVEYLADHLSRRSERMEFPVTAPEQALIDQLHALLDELAIGYKRVLIDRLGRADEDDAPTLIGVALLQAMHFLALRVLHSYSVYCPVPAGLWGELHRLYRYAEQIDVARTRVEHLADQSVGDVYRRVLLLSLANPFHLMQGEARSTNDRLAKWALACMLRHPAEYPPEAPETFYASRCFVDLDGDAPPSWGLIGDVRAPTDARIVDVRPVARIVEDRIRQMTLKGQLPMQERMERDLLRRLRNAWGGRPARAGERSLQSGDVQVVSGLRACHHALSGGAEFHPEQDEIVLHGGAFKPASKLSLVPLEDEPWRQQDVHGKLEQGMLKPRGYSFDAERNEQDAWEHSQRIGAAKTTTQLEERLDNRLLNRRGLLRQRDVSASGIGAQCVGDSGLRFRVGDLVRIGTERAAADSSGLGVVCWLRETAPGQMAVGLYRLEGVATTLAVRGIDGVGADSDYHRALGLSLGNARMLIVPAGIFDLGSHVLYNARAVLGVLVLRRIVHSTKAFTLYGVDSVELTLERREEVLRGLYRLLDSAAH
ncbi:MAG: hypothetical protein HY941_11875 [Gammaproteobacteria bacterium]|nr:hypothetical protein [Gammaproteobacteria bacterium]